MSFEVAADAYDRFMGRYSRQLSAQLADLAGVTAGQRVLDVGCGPGSLTAELVARVSAGNVAAVDPSESFVAAARARNPGVDVRHARAESLPFADGAFDASLAQLVVHFMTDPVAGLGEMRRVTRDGGVVAASVWDHAGDRGPVGLFWKAARDIDPDVHDESALAGAREGHLQQLFLDVGLEDVVATTVVAQVEQPTFEAWWAPFEEGVGPAGAYFGGLGRDLQDALREACRRLIPARPFVTTSVAWACRGVNPGRRGRSRPR